MTYDDVIQVLNCFPKEFVEALQELYYLLKKGQPTRNKMSEVIAMYIAVAEKIYESEDPEVQYLRRMAERSLESDAIAVENVFGLLDLIRIKVEYEKEHKNLADYTLSKSFEDSLDDSIHDVDPFKCFDKREVKRFRERIIYDFVVENPNYF